MPRFTVGARSPPPNERERRAVACLEQLDRGRSARRVLVPGEAIAARGRRAERQVGAAASARTTLSRTSLSRGRPQVRVEVRHQRDAVRGLVLYQVARRPSSRCRRRSGCPTRTSGTPGPSCRRSSSCCRARSCRRSTRRAAAASASESSVFGTIPPCCPPLAVHDRQVAAGVRPAVAHRVVLREEVGDHRVARVALPDVEAAESGEPLAYEWSNCPYSESNA